ncbi:MAG: hypothetical protein KF716_23485 [Anaerolineae bacterium]|nr:hypothetical protein [Anaerolineae bacterium]
MTTLTAIIRGFSYTLIMLTCLAAWLFAPSNKPPQTPVNTVAVLKTATSAIQTTLPTVTAVFQQFEHGWMLRRTDQNCVYVYSYAVRAEGNIVIPSEISFKPFGNYHYCLEVASLPTVQHSDASVEGLQLPTGAFGKLWDAYPEVRDALGYATAPEQPYVATIPPNICYDQFTCTYSPPLLTLPDGRVFSCGMRAASAGTCTVS